METSIHIYTAEAAFGPASAVYCSYAAPPFGSFGLRLLWAFLRYMGFARRGFIWMQIRCSANGTKTRRLVDNQTATTCNMKWKLGVLCHIKELSHYHTSYSHNFLRRLMDIGSSLGTISGTILGYKRDPYVHPKWFLGGASIASSSRRGRN